jgi:Type II secretory pathway, component PulK
MTSIKRAVRKNRQKRYIRRHKRSMLLITLIMLMFVVVVSINGMALRAKNDLYVAQELELHTQIQQAQERAEEIEELRDEIGTDDYIKKVASEKLRLVNPGELVFRSAE